MRLWLRLTSGPTSERRQPLPVPRATRDIEHPLTGPHIHLLTQQFPHDQLLDAQLMKITRRPRLLLRTRSLSRAAHRATVLEQMAAPATWMPPRVRRIALLLRAGVPLTAAGHRDADAREHHRQPERTVVRHPLVVFGAHPGAITQRTHSGRQGS